MKGWGRDKKGKRGRVEMGIASDVNTVIYNL
jgi:hypothetical protein